MGTLTKSQQADNPLERCQRRNVNVEEGIVCRHKRAAAVKRFFDAT
jgi:hypothetical protein